MGEVSLEWQKTPMISKDISPLLGLCDSFIKKNAIIEPTPANVGNPHIVTIVKDISKVPLEKIGPMIENHPLFPNRTNVEFVQFIDQSNLKMRVWERSVGITQACGSGSCAVAFIANSKGIVGSKVNVHQDGGVLTIEIIDKKRVIMTGPAVEVFKAQIQWISVPIDET